MNLAAWMCYGSAAAAIAAAGVVFFREARTVAGLAYIGGMLALAVEAVLYGIRFGATTPAEMLHWEYQRLVAMAFLPAPWLVFALSYSRGNSSEFLLRWRYGIATALLLPLVLVFGFGNEVVLRAYALATREQSYVVMSWAGTSLHVVMLCVSVLVLLNLERTFRASVGTMRWRIKFMVIGVGLLFAARIYTSSQSILFRVVDLMWGLADAGALLLASILALRSFWRSGVAGVDVYPSRQVIQNSLTVLLTGLYLVSVGVFARVVDALGGDAAFGLKAVGVLVMVVMLPVLLMSDRVQRQLQLFVTRHFRRPEHDYRRVWMTYVERTAPCGSEEELCRAIVRWVSETFNALTVSIWLTDDARNHVRFGGSTSFGDAEARELLSKYKPNGERLRGLVRHAYPEVIEASAADLVREVGRFNPIKFPEGGNRVCVPLIAAGELQGVLVVGDRVLAAPFGAEDFELLRCIGNQVAGNLRNIELSDKLVQGKEMEAFQAISTFFVHDLKNTASTLSLMLKNLPAHFHDAEFRQDALRVIGKTVDRITDLIARLSMLRRRIEMNPALANLNQVVEVVLENLQKAHRLPVYWSPGELPSLRLDSEQLQKVLTNLVLNAKDAISADGKIEITTVRQDRWAVLVVADNGSGMSPEFLARSLFRPFQTTKKKGIGIGMFHSKAIVDAHHGLIEVDSEAGRGTTFKVLLPLDVA